MAWHGIEAWVWVAAEHFCLRTTGEEGHGKPAVERRPFFLSVKDPQIWLHLVL